jgi:hypothetical protein
LKTDLLENFAGHRQEEGLLMAAADVHGVGVQQWVEILQAVAHLDKEDVGSHPAEGVAAGIQDNPHIQDEEVGSFREEAVLRVEFRSSLPGGEGAGVHKLAVEDKTEA